MTSTSLDWHKIETALGSIAFAYGFNIERDISGDLCAIHAVTYPDTDTIDDLNLTELAKDLERELS